MTCSQASWRKRFPSMASAENFLHTLQKRLWVSLRCRQGSRRPRNFFLVVRAGPEGCGWLSATCLRTKPKVNRLALSTVSLLDYSTVCSTITGWKSSPGSCLCQTKNWLATQRLELSSFMDDRCVQETTRKKKELMYSKGGGGSGGGGRVRMCQVNVTRITRKVFEILNFVFGNLSFVFRPPYSTVCSHTEQSAKLGSPNWTLGRKVSRQIGHRGLWSGRKKYFLVANGD